jgi:hypothetical protein
MPSKNRTNNTLGNINPPDHRETRTARRLEVEVSPPVQSLQSSRASERPTLSD